MGEIVQLNRVECYRAEPEGPPRGVMILIHEIWGLVDHIRSVADRWAGEGWIVVAPDLLSGIGTTPDVGVELMGIMQSTDEKVRLDNQTRLRDAFARAQSPEFAEDALRDLVRVVDAVADEPGVDGRIVTAGFCFGGGYAMELAAEDRRVRAAVSFYGAPLSEERLQGLRSPILALYGDQDERLMSSLEGFEEAADRAHVELTTKVYPGAAHAFFNDTGANYDAEAADDAWVTANAFLDRVVGAR